MSMKKITDIQYSLVGVAISLAPHISLAKTVVAIALAMVLIFSGFLLRSFGKGKEERLGNE
jgi:uncharacterized membrane protein